MIGRKQNLEVKIPSLNQRGIDADGNIIQNHATSKVQNVKGKRGKKSQDALDKHAAKKIRAQVVNDHNESIYERSIPEDNVGPVTSTIISLNEEEAGKDDDDVVVELGTHDNQHEVESNDPIPAPNQQILVQKIIGLLTKSKSN